MSAAEAGDELGLPADVVRALADAGYLRADLTTGTPRFARGDLKAFRARLDRGELSVVASGWSSLAMDADELEPSALLAALDVRATAMAEQTLALLASVYPTAAEFSSARRERFDAEARRQLEAIIGLCARGPVVGHEPLEDDLAEVGVAAAHAGVPLPGILLALRITRDLVVQTAIETAEARGRQWGSALSVTLTRVLPAIDRLSDAVARGYREAVLEIEAESLDRYRNLAECLDDGIFAIDGDGIVRYVNPALSAALRRPAADLVGVPLLDVLSLGAGAAPAEVSVGGSRFRVEQVERIRDGVVAGWDGIVRRAP